MLFGVPAEKDEQGSGAWDEEGVVQLATRAIKQALPELLVVTDVCLCEYTAHGHCGVLREDGAVDNDATLELLARTAVSHARAGADIVAPSDMMDGRVGAIREELDGEGFAETPILAYSAKFASAFYGPFREAAGSTPAFGDRRGYQMDPANGARGGARGAARRAGGRRHGDGQARARLRRSDQRGQATRRGLPVAAYNVSGEYAMVKAAAAAGYLDERATVLEILTSLRRAGADTIITYHAKDAARWLARAELIDDDADAAERAAAAATPKIRSRKDGAAVAARRRRPRAAEPDAGQLPDRAAPLPARRRAGGGLRGGGDGARRSGCSTSASSARSRRSSTRARSATPRCSSPRRSTPSTRTAPPR